MCLKNARDISYVTLKLIFLRIFVTSGAGAPRSLSSSFSHAAVCLLLATAAVFVDAVATLTCLVSRSTSEVRATLTTAAGGVGTMGDAGEVAS